jgi:hypothetical protein
MRVRLPDINIPAPQQRWKRGAIVEVSTREEVEELVARGGQLVDETEPAPAAPAAAAPAKGGGKGKGSGKGSGKG